MSDTITIYTLLQMYYTNARWLMPYCCFFYYVAQHDICIYFTWSLTQLKHFPGYFDRLCLICHHLTLASVMGVYCTPSVANILLDKPRPTNLNPGFYFCRVSCWVNMSFKMYIYYRVSPSMFCRLVCLFPCLTFFLVVC